MGQTVCLTLALCFCIFSALAYQSALLVSQNSLFDIRFVFSVCFPALAYQSAISVGQTICLTFVLCFCVCFPALAYQSAFLVGQTVCSMFLGLFSLICLSECLFCEANSLFSFNKCIYIHICMFV